MKPGERFSSRVDDYQKYRPDYPQSLVDYLQAQLAVPAEHIRRQSENRVRDDKSGD